MDLMESKVENFRAQATECERAAKATWHKGIKRDYLDIARQWRELARQIEDLEHKSGDRM
jgi:hypothetical protein